MKASSWLRRISPVQRLWLVGTLTAMVGIVLLGIALSPSGRPEEAKEFDTGSSIADIAPDLGVTGKALARELGLPVDISKRQPLKALGITQEELQHTAEHLISHRDSMLKYYVFAALVLGGLVFLIRLGRPDASDARERSQWFPRAPYVALLIVSVVVAGFVLGKSPNPMEGAVKVFKSLAGLYPDPAAKAAAFLFFIALAIIGNKMICGWACPFGALQELAYSIPILKRTKRHKLPFVWANAIRGGLLAVMLLLLFGIVGGREGIVVYHYINPFNLFSLSMETLSILLAVVITLAAALAVYRPFCQLVCPFGFVSWIAERISILRIRIDRDRCTQCGACVKACPLEAAKGRVYSRRLPADCFSCARCLNVCPVDAIGYGLRPPR